MPFMPEDEPLWRIEFHAPAGAAEALADAVAPFCQAVSQLPGNQPGHWRIDGWCRNQPDAAALARALAEAARPFALGPPPVAITRVPPRDWLADNIGAFPPVDAGRYFIHGTHHHAPVPSGRIGLCLDSGPAFGSGEHASTMGCLLALDQLARRHRFRAPLDLGCGSGILALAIAATWRVDVLAADVDPRAVAVARANARRNRLARRLRVIAGDAYRAPEIRRRSPFDLIVANVLADPLCRWAPDLTAHLAPGGVAVLAGFLERDARRVFAAHRQWNLMLVRRITIDGWQTLVLRSSS
jgi:ribosomal protein L11 methyltransferase